MGPPGAQVDMSDPSRSESKYERMKKIGIGSYGVVFKCINRTTGQLVAIKRYSEDDSDPVIRRIAMREVKMLRQLKHPNLINLIEVFRRKKRLHLVFDYCELTVLDVIERYADNCPSNLVKKIVWQIVNGISYCHDNNCIHRDIKPENILINQWGVVKICDFGFARNINATIKGPVSKDLALNYTTRANHEGESRIRSPADKTEARKENISSLDELDKDKGRQAFTEYVATRWYRAPELLIGEIYYDIKIDIWAIGCVTAELIRGEPLFPGKTDLDQLMMIKRSLGDLTGNQISTLLSQGVYDQADISELVKSSDRPTSQSLKQKLPPKYGHEAIDFIATTLEMDPGKRPMSADLLRHNYIYSPRMGQFLKEATGFDGPPSMATATKLSSSEVKRRASDVKPIAPSDPKRSSMASTNQDLVRGAVQSRGDKDAVATGISIQKSRLPVSSLQNNERNRYNFGNSVIHRGPLEAASSRGNGVQFDASSNGTYDKKAKSSPMKFGPPSYMSASNWTPTTKPTPGRGVTVNERDAHTSISSTTSNSHLSFLPRLLPANEPTSQRQNVGKTTGMSVKRNRVARARPLNDNHLPRARGT